MNMGLLILVLILVVYNSIMLTLIHRSQMLQGYNTDIVLGPVDL